MASPCLNVVWTASGTDANDYLSVHFRYVPTITSLNYRQPRLTGVFIEECNVLTTVTLPNCTTIEGYGNTDFLSIEPIQIGFNDLLASISFSALTTLRTGFYIVNNPVLTSVDFSALTTIDIRTLALANTTSSLSSNASLTSVSFPALTTITKSAGVSGALSIASNVALTSISIPVLTVPDGFRFIFTNNALTEASVDHVLARCVANAGFVSGRVDLNGGTNAVPSATGLADKATLIGRGVTVNTN